MILLSNFLFANKVIVLATDPFPPFHSPEVKGYGFFAEIVDQAFRAKGYELKIEFVPWNRALENGANGYYHGVIGALYSDERDKSFYFSDSVYKLSSGLYVRDDFPYTLKEFEKIKGLKLGKVSGYFYPGEKEVFKNFSIVENTSLENNLGALINKRVDVIAESNVVIENLLNNRFAKHKDSVKLLKALENEDYMIMVSKKVEKALEIKEAFNEGLKIIKRNGTYDKILKKYGIKNNY